MTNALSSMSWVKLFLCTCVLVAFFQLWDSSESQRIRHLDRNVKRKIQIYHVQAETEDRHMELGVVPRDNSLPPPAAHTKKKNTTPKHARTTFFSRPEIGKVAQYLTLLGWKGTNIIQNASFLWFQKKQEIPWDSLLPWQRTNHLKHERELGHKGRFLHHLKRHKQRIMMRETGGTLYKKGKPISFLPDSYESMIEKDRLTFLKLAQDRNSFPWITKIPHVDGGKGIRIIDWLSDAHKALVKMLKGPAAHRQELIIQKYIKNIMLYHGRKFDLRVYWFVVSVKPLIVYYHDGTLRVSLTKYLSTNYTNLGSHLTNAVMQKKSKKYEKLKESTRVSLGDFEKYLHQHASKYAHKTIEKPIEYIRCQIKQAILLIVKATMQAVLLKDIDHTENGFSLLGADFMVDNNMNIWITEVQSGPGLPQDTEAMASLMLQMIPQVVDSVLEVRQKQENGVADIDILPLKSMKSFELIFAPNYAFQC